MRDLLSLLFSVLGFSGLGFWFRAKLFLGAERDKEIKSWKLGGTFPACPGVLGSEAEASGDIAAEAKEPFIVLEPDKVEGDFPYFVTISRSGFRRLHLSGACAVRQEKCIETVGVLSISEGCADAICKHCRPKVDANESSSSGSEAAEAY